MKYAIKVPVDDGWLYVTEPDLDGNLIAKTFDTREEAEAFEAGAFNFDSLSQVVEYREDLVETLTEEEIEEQAKALDGLSKLSQMMEESRVKYETENDAWWNDLTEKEREDAFYAVCKRIHQAEIKDQGSYRWALYKVFGFDMGMYLKGMQCGFMDIHNSIGMEKE